MRDLGRESRPESRPDEKGRLGGERGRSNLGRSDVSRLGDLLGSGENSLLRLASTGGLRGRVLYGDLDRLLGGDLGRTSRLGEYLRGGVLARLGYVSSLPRPAGLRDLLRKVPAGGDRLLVLGILELVEGT